MNHIQWDEELLDRLFRASGLSSKDYLKRVIRRLAHDLDIDLKHPGDDRS